MGRSETTIERLEASGAQWTDLGEVQAVDHYGDVQAEYMRVVEGGLGIIERGERETLIIGGDDAVPWLQGLVTSDIHALVDEGNGQRTSMVNTTGRFVGEARILHLPELLFLDLEPGTLQGGMWGHLRRHIILEKVKLDDRSAQTARLGVYGRDAAELLSEIATWVHPLADRPPFFGTWGSLDDMDLIAQRVVWFEQPGFEISCALDAVPRILDAIEKNRRHLPLFGRQAFEILRIEAGVPRFGQELHDKVIPLEAGFEDAIAFEKGCYLGQEIIARLDTLGTPAKMLRRLVFDGDKLPEKDTDLFDPEKATKKVGHIESAVHSFEFDAPVALAFIKRGFNDIDSRVVVDGMEGTIWPLLDIREL